MSEIRQDIITGNYVVIAVERSKRPHDFSRQEEADNKGFCPFCYGNEKETPPELAALRDSNNLAANTPGWQIRVVSNKFAAFQEEEFEINEDGIYKCLTGKGAAEVVIESADHEANFSSYTLLHIQKLLMIIQERYKKLSRDDDLKYIQIFKNHGASAGSSLKHPHWQIMATPLVPSLQLAELKGAAEYYRKKGECVYCKIIREEKDKKIRVVAENEDFISICPYASRFPMETWILPKEHKSIFGSLRESQLTNLAEILKGLLSLLEDSLSAPYNLVIHTRPIDNQSYEFYHWHIEILPRLTVAAGFELGTGWQINPLSPEKAAEYMVEKVEL